MKDLWTTRHVLSLQYIIILQSFILLLMFLYLGGL